MQTQNAHLLVIEDRADNLNELLMWLREDFGYEEIVTATTTAEALEKLADPFDIIVSDMRMYDEADAGFTILDWVQQRNLSSVVIIFTANESLEDCYRAWKSKAWDYISKNPPTGNAFDTLNDSIQEAIAYLNRWGNLSNQQWFAENQQDLEAKYWGQYIAIANQVVIDFADSETELFTKLEERKLRRFTTTIKKIGDLRSIEELIQLGESDTLEFKSSLQWDVRENTKNEKLQDSVLKSIAAFLNSEGGTVIIGVEDNGNLFGLEKDIQSFKDPRNRTLDNFERHLVELIKNKIGIKFLPYLKIRFTKINDQDICGVYVRKASQAAFLKSERGLELYVRTGNSTRSLSVPEIYDYL
ncbi:putative DNA binding domain-containing protein [Pseudanabaena sp. FACHB-1277]|uniref:DNA binding domain-containing protein n=1 Tax=Pseudanabaena cinerea FACHB-1277 TaxID=2949581 RepID=A0A926Z4D7_9CYAN|nr:RNA-binding domain-containing protein [Pseudanabaena cinerea]MBD2148610.1 putative DNA binding domain-containing protein [Pseudanabaena cinerea FACHB-1277]